MMAPSESTPKQSLKAIRNETSQQRLRRTLNFMTPIPDKRASGLFPPKIPSMKDSVIMIGQQNIEFTRIKPTKSNVESDPFA